MITYMSLILNKSDVNVRQNNATLIIICHLNNCKKYCVSIMLNFSLKLKENHKRERHFFFVHQVINS